MCGTRKDALLQKQSTLSIVVLKIKFKNHEEKVYMEVLQGFEHIYKQIGRESKEGLIKEEDLADRAMDLYEE